LEFKTVGELLLDMKIPSNEGGAALFDELKPELELPDAPVGIFPIGAQRGAPPLGWAVENEIWWFPKVGIGVGKVGTDRLPRLDEL